MYPRRMSRLHWVDAEPGIAKQLLCKLTGSGPEHTLLLDLDGAEPVEAERSRLAAHVVEAQQIPGGPVDEHRVRLEAPTGRFAGLFHVSGLDDRFTDKCHLKAPHD